MHPQTTTAPKETPTGRHLRDIAGNPVYRDKDDNRVLLRSLPLEYTRWEVCKFALTLPLAMYRQSAYLRHATELSLWTAPDPTVFVPSGAINPLYSPKYEDEPPTEPE
ncbi:hypothetical protein JCM5353_008952 [Sporobolomyces roseus]